MSQVRSVLHEGFSGIVVDVECHLSNGLPCIVIVGLGNKAVNEARERIRSAFASNKIPLPRKRITINLAPADIQKESTGLDLPMAISILQASGAIPEVDQKQAFIGELGLDGHVRGVRGLIGKILAAKESGIEQFFIPRANVPQALLIPAIKVFGVDTLQALFEALRSEKALNAAASGVTLPAAVDTEASLFDDIVGQDRAKRVLTIAAAGGHNILLSGPPGTGKSLLAKTLPDLLPPPSTQEMLEVTHLHSLANTNYEQLVTQRPFRAPHQSISYSAMVGGGHNSKPGEVTLSHHGVLLLDEMPEFRREVIEALRQPLEDGMITISRLKDTITYSADFILAATANPCPCGYYGSESGSCSCSPYKIESYHNKISGPLLDRIDLFIEVEPVAYELLLGTGTRSSDFKAASQQIVVARQAQSIRSPKTNARMANKDIRLWSNINTEAIAILNKAADQLQLSARGYMRTLKVARTIADLAQSDFIVAEHIAEALQYRLKTHSALS